MQQLLNANGEKISVADVFIAVENGFEGRTGGETVLYQESVIGAGCTIAEYTPPPFIPVIDVPNAVTMRQARLALLQAGLLDKIDAAINSLPEPQKYAAKIEWEYSQEVQITSKMAAFIAQIIGLSSEQVNQLFIKAAGIKP